MIADITAAPPSQSRFPMSRALLFDIAERTLVVLLGAWLIYRFMPTLSEHPFGHLLLLSEGLIVLLIAVRRFGHAVNTFRAWSLAIVGTVSPLLVLPAGDQLASGTVAAAAMLTGLTISISAKLFLRRSFGIVAANRGVERRGPYRLVRHPMYLGYLFSHAAYLLMSFSVWNLAVYTACWIAMVLRISVEENVLREDALYQDYAAAVRFRLIPGIW